MRVRVLALTFAVLAASAVVSHGRGEGLYPEGTADGPLGANVALDAAIRITWTMEMNSASVEAAFVLTDCGVWMWDASAFDWFHSAAPPWSSRASPRSPYPAETNLCVVVAPTAREASGAYALDQDRDGTGGEPTDALAWTFRTENGTPPRVLATAPSGSDPRVGVAANVTIAFDEPMDAASVEAGLRLSPETTGTVRWNVTRTGVTFDPALNLFYGTTYEVRLLGNAAKDENGHALDGDGDGVGGDDFAFNFTTEPDVSPPRVLSTFPLDGATAASATASFVVRFEESMDRAFSEAAFSYTDGTASWDRDDGEFSWSGAVFPDDILVFNPFANLPFSANITATLNGSAARDRAGFLLDGNGDGTAEGAPTDDVTWSFAMEAADRTPPSVLAVSPAHEASDVLETVSIGLTFTEAMDRTSVEDAFAMRDLQRTWTKADGLFTWSRGDDRVSYTPSMTLSFDDLYSLAIGPNATDLAGNPLAPPFASTFRTRPEPDTIPPAVVSTFPLDGARDVPREVRVSVTFSDAMDRARTEGSITLVRRTGDATPIPLTDFAWDAGDSTVSFLALSALDWEVGHRVTVGPAAKDDAGNLLAEAFSFSFTATAWWGRVIGRVVDAEGPLSGATVRLGDSTTQTTENGSFSFPTAVAGTYELLVSKAGYETARRTVTLSHRVAGPDFARIDLGEIRMEPAEEFPAVALASGLVALAAGAIVLAVLRRRLRPLPIESLEEDVEDLEEEYEKREA